MRRGDESNRLGRTGSRSGEREYGCWCFFWVGVLARDSFTPKRANRTKCTKRWPHTQSGPPIWLQSSCLGLIHLSCLSFDLFVYGSRLCRLVPAVPQATSTAVSVLTINRRHWTFSEEQLASARSEDHSYMTQDEYRAMQMYLYQRKTTQHLGLD